MRVRIHAGGSNCFVVTTEGYTLTDKDIKETAEDVEVEEDAPEGAEDTSEDVEVETKDAGEKEKDPPADKAEKPERQTTVPHQALHAERTRRQTVERELREAREKQARLEERTNIILERLNQQTQEQVPDREQDPVTYLAYQDKRLKALEGEQQQTQAQQRQMQEYQRQVTERDALLADAVPEFTSAAEADPHVKPAYDHWLQARGQELMWQGLNRQQVEDAIKNEEAFIVKQARSRGLDLGEVIKQVAAYRGFAPQKATGENGAEKLDKLKNAQERNKSLSQAGGTPAASGKITAKTLLDMEPHEFEAWVEKNPKAWARLAGA